LCGEGNGCGFDLSIFPCFFWGCDSSTATYLVVSLMATRFFPSSCGQLNLPSQRRKIVLALV